MKIPDVANMESLHPLAKQVLIEIEAGSRYRATLKSVESKVSDDVKVDIVSLDFEVVGICQYPCCDIRAVEPIRIEIIDGVLPAVFLERDDFPALPHMNLHENNTIRSICYSDEPYSEIKRRMTGAFLLHCINSWFVKSAKGELHRNDQALEPFFLGSQDVIIIDTSSIGRNEVFWYFDDAATNGQRILKQVKENSIANATRYAVWYPTAQSREAGIINRIPKTVHDLAEALPDINIIGSFKSYYDTVMAVKHDQDKYTRLFGSSANKLMNCNAMVIIAVPLMRNASTKHEGWELKAFIIDVPFGDAIADFGYVKRVEHKKKRQVSRIVLCPENDNSGRNIPIKMFNVHFAFNRQYAQILSQGSQSENDQQKIVQIGAGAIGSHIFNNCTRSGFGSWTLIDNDRFWPHNLARHILDAQDVGQYKADALVRQSRNIIFDDDSESIPEDIFHGGVKMQETLQNANLIIDASASIAVERYLALDIATSARKVSCFLNPSGTATIMLVEDTGSQVRLDLLEMQYYRSLLLSSKYENHLLQPDKVTYSTSCRSVTSRLSPDDIAIGAALCSKTIKTLSREPKSHIIIWNHSDGVFGKDVFEGEYWSVCKVSEWSVYTRKDLLDEFQAQRTDAMPNETGGVLVGSYDYSRKIIYIVHQITSPDDSISSPNSYIRGCAKLTENLEKIENVTKANLHYLGEWHSHLSKDTRQSSNDKVLFGAIASFNSDMQRPVCMIIVGDGNNSIYISE